MVSGMKRMLELSTFRSVRHTFSRFIAIFGIIAIGCGFFAGVKAAGPDLKISAEKYLEQQRLADIHLISTLGFDDENVAAYEDYELTEKSQAGYSAELFASYGSQSGRIVKAYSYSADDEINLPLLIDGRLPQRKGECVVDAHFYSAETPEIGSVISLSANDGKLEDILEDSEYTVVGYVQSPVYIAFERGTASIGNGVINGFVLIPKESFNTEVFTDIYIRVKDASDYSTFSEDYDVFIGSAEKSYEQLGEAELEKRVKSISDEADKEIGKAKDKLNDAEKKYTDGENEYNDGLKTVDGLKSIVTELESTLEVYSDSTGSAEDAEKIIGRIDAYTDDFKADDNLKMLINTYVTATPMLAPMLRPAARTGITQYINVISDSADEAEEKLDEARETLDDARIELDDGRTELEKAERDAADAVSGAELYVFDRDEYNPYFSHYSEDCDRVDAIARVFPIFFILVAALVCCTTMTRMVEEQRVQIGTLKALGYGRFAIISQYIIYAVAASIPGAFAGLAIGFRVLPQVIYMCYKSMYNQPFMLTPFRWNYAIGCAVAACLCTGLSSLYAARKELVSKPAQLMRPKPPKNGRRILLEHVTFIWKRLKFTYKVTCRNLFRYKARLLMTVIGIAGCTALLLTGFGLRYSIVSIVDKQYGDIFIYDALAALDPDYEDESYTDVINAARDSGAVSGSMLAEQRSGDIYNSDGESAEIYMVIPDKTEELDEYFGLRERIGHKSLTLDDSGIIITEKLSDVLGIKVGEKLHFDSGSELTVKGIAENYTFNYVYMSRALYEASGFDKPYENNVLLINMTDGGSSDALSEAIVNRSEVLGVTYLAGGGDKFRNLVSSLSYIVVAIIVSAGALAFVVLFNLANINVNERVHELATIKVLGFYDGEVAAYIYRENTISAVLGMLAGLVLGIFLERFVVKTAEVDAVMFSPDIPLSSFAYAALLTLIFAAVVNIFLYFRLKKIDMAASLKAIE